MRDLLQDYVQSGDSEATMKQIKQWEVPHFNHEIVYDVSIYFILILLNEANQTMGLTLITKLFMMLVFIYYIFYFIKLSRLNNLIVLILIINCL